MGTLYLGNTAISPVKDYDFTAMGNELRQAYCWTYFQNAKGMCQLYDSFTNLFSEPFEATNVYLGIKTPSMYTSDSNNHSSTYNCYIVIDGKLYTIASNSSNITMTQYGTDTDWQKVLYYVSPNYALKNNSVYTNVSSLSNPILTNCENIEQPGFTYSSNNTFISDDYSLYYSGVKQGNYKFIAYLPYFSNLYGIGITNNKLCSYLVDTGSYKTILNSYTITNPTLIVSGHNVSSIAFAINNILYCCYYDNSSGDISIKKEIVFSTNRTITKLKCFATGGGDYLVLLDNGEVYRVNGTTLSTVLFTNAKDIIGNYWRPLVLTSDNKLYSATDCSLIYDFGKDTVICNSNNFDVFIQCFKYTSQGEIKDNKYTIKYPDSISKAYILPNDPINSLSVDNVSNYSITVANRKYRRNGVNDSVFTFIPEDLNNHTFTDQDLLEAYLNAGLTQQNNS